METWPLTDPTHAGLLRAVLETPEDDVPRLVLADWLEENGWHHPARFIHRQIEVKDADDHEPITVPHSWPGDAIRLMFRTPYQFYADRRESGIRGESLHLVYRRGFVEAVSCDLATLMGIAPRLFASQPVTKVTLTDAVVHPSGGNDTYYLGGLGHFPSEYWRSLENLPSRRAVMDATSAVCVAYGRANAEGHRHGVCETCDGHWLEETGVASTYDHHKRQWVTCPDCDGTGTKPGLPPLAGLAVNDPTPAEV